jgi:hypothetical protein
MTFRAIIIFLILGYVIGCAPKPATKSTVKEYDEDLSELRPELDASPKDTETEFDMEISESPYVAPSNDINEQMALVMDSIIYHNRNKANLTYTIQVYIGRSREEANQIREKVYRVLPEETPQLGYKQPSWKVTVGEYRDRVEAYKTLTALKAAFPAAMLVPERKYIE